MYYPLKFNPHFKDYIWGGRNLDKFGKTLPEGIVAESWEISSHPDGISTVANGEFAGMQFTEVVLKLGRELVGTALRDEDVERFPLLVKLIDANDKLSVQVHPEDEYAYHHENGELGKNEMWYIISAEPGAQLIYDVAKGINRESFTTAIENGKVGDCLKSVEVFAGDVINIPAGLVHAIGKGIVLAEIQQNSNTTYRVYDYERVDKFGKQRPLHIGKALDVIDFASAGRKEKAEGLRVALGEASYKDITVANQYFSIEVYHVNGTIEECADGSRFFIYVIIEGEGKILYEEGSMSIKTGDSLLIPATLGEYMLEGSFKALKAYVPNLYENVVLPLKQAGYTEAEIYEKVSGLS